MIKNISNSFLVLAIVCLTVACKSKKAIVATPKAVDSTAVNSNKKAENFALLKSKDMAYNTLSLKGKANLDINGNANNVSINIRIQKDQKIWASITALAGLEVARALITPDSILVINRLQSTYLQKPFTYIHGFTNKQINFGMLQAVLSGNTIQEYLAEPSELKFDNGVWVLEGRKETLAYKLLFNTLLKVAETNLNDVRSGQAFKVVNSQYQDINKSLYPSVMSINSMSGTKKINIDLNFSKVESNVPLDFPFSVPKRFEVIK
jgi:hypothetical protein